MRITNERFGAPDQYGGARTVQMNARLTWSGCRRPCFLPERTKRSVGNSPQCGTIPAKQIGHFWRARGSVHCRLSGPLRKPQVSAD